jgi:hypothetical protein
VAVEEANSQELPVTAVDDVVHMVRSAEVGGAIPDNKSNTRGDKSFMLVSFYGTFLVHAVSIL